MGLVSLTGGLLTAAFALLMATLFGWLITWPLFVLDGGIQRATFTMRCRAARLRSDILVDAALLLSWGQAPDAERAVRIASSSRSLRAGDD